MYHLSTHAFFKALLFLGAGSVIHSLHHEQNIWNMGGLKSRMPVTFWTFLIGTLALAGVPPFSGFYSKDEVLAAAYHHNLPLFALGLLVAVLTTFYMLRLFLVAFLGRPRTAAAEGTHESPPVMTTPLLALAVPSLLAGFWGIHQVYLSQFGVAGTPHGPGWLSRAFAPFSHAPVVALASLGAVCVGLLLAWPLYYGAQRDPLQDKLGAFARVIRNRFYLDELYQAIIDRTQELLATVAEAVDRWVVAGLLVRGTHGSVELLGRVLRLVQTGNIQTYAFLFAAGIALVLLFMLRS
jgi:NADH-quinone oxidoreductase subunit L